MKNLFLYLSLMLLMGISTAYRDTPNVSVKPDGIPDIPKCIKLKIRKITREEVINPVAEVWEWKVDGGTYYYFAYGCCDNFNYLYDKECNRICAPDGGLTGKGDGKCPVFKSEVKKKLIWQNDKKLR